MDAEIWSHADIRNGRWLFAILSTVILLQEVAVVSLLAAGYPLVTFAAGGGPFATLPDLVRATFGLILSILLLMLALTGRGWARVSLGLVAVLASIGTVAKVAGPLRQALMATDVPDPPLLVSVGLAGLGLIAGTLFILLPPLRAFGWSRSTARDAIPVPVDNGPAPRRALRRHQTTGERMVAFFSALGDGLIILIVVALWALVYGVDEWLRPLLAR